MPCPAAGKVSRVLSAARQQAQFSRPMAQGTKQSSSPWRKRTGVSQRDANVLHSRAPIHRPRMLMTPCRAKQASAHGAASSMTARQSASSRLRAAMRSHCPRETGVTPK